ncbi:hypothetical protein [Ligilactobacillus salivarius]|nr:hypothetical protein [Ligilactobacillus salivarius]
MGILQDSSLGLDPFSCFVTGIANIFGSSYGTFYGYLSTGMVD